MQQRSFGRFFVVAVLISTPVIGAAPSDVFGLSPNGLDEPKIPGNAPASGLPGIRMFGPDGPRATPFLPTASEPGSARNGGAQTPAVAPKTAAEKAAALKKALAPKPTPDVIRAQVLDDLFKRLHASSDEDEAKGIAGAIEHVWLRSDSDTANLLMQRALASMQAKRYPLALSLLDQVVALQSDWVEGWNKRATTRFLADDLDGAMADIDEVLKREPRHFGALAGLAVILQRTGFDKRALDVFRRTLAVYPHQPEIEKAVEKLSLDVEGRDI